MDKRLELILGGARSGKSRLAEQRCRESRLQLVYVATAQAGDKEMAERIAHHRSRRNSEWLLVEEPVDLATVVREYANVGHCLLVDCLTLWLSNCLYEKNWQQRRQDFFDALNSTEGQVIMVSNEVGMGVVPMGELSRTFVDESGFLHQQLAVLCQRVTLVAAGLPLDLKNELKSGLL
ncbi:MAG: bifunctional adenosylcobinamide kinase/adenosylcobinamide-phosphate guanylyltransferase [Porticoccaceae bacterium]